MKSLKRRRTRRMGRRRRWSRGRSGMRKTRRRTKRRRIGKGRRGIEWGSSKIRVDEVGSGGYAKGDAEWR